MISVWRNRFTQGSRSSLAAVALAVLVWVVWMQRKDIADLRRSAEADRSRADSPEEPACTTLAVISHLTGQALPVPPQALPVPPPHCRAREPGDGP